MRTETTPTMTATTEIGDGLPPCPEHDWIRSDMWTGCYPIAVGNRPPMNTMVAFELQTCPLCTRSRLLASLGDERATVRVDIEREGGGLPDVHELVPVAMQAVQSIGEKMAAALAVSEREKKAAETAPVGDPE